MSSPPVIQFTTEALITLSETVASLYSIKAFSGAAFDVPGSKWMFEDNSQCFALMVQHNISISIKYSWMIKSQVKATSQDDGIFSLEDFKPHIAKHLSELESKQQAVRVAILKCLAKMKGITVEI